LILAHAMPTGPGAAANAAHTLPELADRVARETGWAALSFSFRGAGRSPGRFSPSGWLEDLEAAVGFLRSEVSTVWLAGFGLGGTLALRLAALDGAIGGVAALATPSDLSPWAANPAALAAAAHEAGFLDSEHPEGLETWEADIRSIDPLRSAAAVPPRPLLIVHGSADPEVPLVDARALADAAEGNGDLRVVPKAGHILRHDPRVIAILLGWLERREG
jgi:putative redox protein